MIRELIMGELLVLKPICVPGSTVSGWSGLMYWVYKFVSANPNPTFNLEAGSRGGDFFHSFFFLFFFFFSFQISEHPKNGENKRLLKLFGKNNRI